MNIGSRPAKRKAAGRCAPQVLRGDTRFSLGLVLLLPM
jgi:hypothetical protein